MLKNSWTFSLFISFVSYGLGQVSGVSQELWYFRHDGGVAGDHHPLPDNFREDGQLLWQVPLDGGHSSPCVVGDTVYVTTYRPEKQELATVALDRRSGQLRWKQVAPTTRIEPFHPVGSPAAASPACDGERVYVFFGSYGLLCYDTSGKLVWSKPLGPFQDEFGASSSPVLAGDLVILNEDHDVNSFLLAVNKRTGETVWQTSRAEFVRSYSTPIVIDAGGQQQVVVAGSLQLTGYDLRTGERLWWVEGISRIVDSTPCYANGLVYLATWTPGGDDDNRITMEPYHEALVKYDQNKDSLIQEDELPEGEVRTRFYRMDINQDGQLDQFEWQKYARVFERAKNVALAVDPRGRGDLSNTGVIWTYRRSLPTVPSSVVYRGVLYMVKDGGIVTSLDAATGQPLHQGRAVGPGNYYASLVAGDGKVYLCSEQGVMTILRADRRWEILASHNFGERIMATPTIRDGQVFIRTEKWLACYRKRHASG